MTVAKEAIRIWRTSDCSPRVSSEDLVGRLEGRVSMAVHPGGEYICVAGKCDVYWYSTYDLEQITTYNGM